MSFGKFKVDEKGVLQRVNKKFISLSKQVAPTLSMNQFSLMISNMIERDKIRKKSLKNLRVNQEDFLYGKFKKR